MSRSAARQDLCCLSAAAGEGIPLMGESSFLASWVNRRAMMMGMCVCVFKKVLLLQSALQPEACLSSPSRVLHNVVLCSSM